MCNSNGGISCVAKREADDKGCTFRDVKYPVGRFEVDENTWCICKSDGSFGCVGK